MPLSHRLNSRWPWSHIPLGLQRESSLHAHCRTAAAWAPDPPAIFHLLWPHGGALHGLCCCLCGTRLHLHLCLGHRGFVSFKLCSSQPLLGDLVWQGPRSLLCCYRCHRCQILQPGWRKHDLQRGRWDTYPQILYLMQSVRVLTP